jgi:hypothetical protein
MGTKQRSHPVARAAINHKRISPTTAHIPLKEQQNNLSFFN